ncbi:hypothetical protein WJ972_06000 [Achromobacter insuavis]
MLLPFCLLWGGNAGAQSATAAGAYPQRPVNLIVPWPPGGAVDLLARQLGTVLARELGQPIVIENGRQRLDRPRPGGARGAGRLHHPAGHQQHLRDRPAPVQAAAVPA